MQNLRRTINRMLVRLFSYVFAQRRSRTGIFYLFMHTPRVDGERQTRISGPGLIVFNCANFRASASLSARTMIGLGLHIFQIGSVKFVGVSFQMRIPSISGLKGAGHSRVE
jgi:hypothetical protein